MADPSFNGLTVENPSQIAFPMQFRGLTIENPTQPIFNFAAWGDGYALVEDSSIPSDYWDNLPPPSSWIPPKLVNPDFEVWDVVASSRPWYVGDKMVSGELDSPLIKVDDLQGVSGSPDFNKGVKVPHLNLDDGDSPYSVLDDITILFVYAGAGDVIINLPVVSGRSGMVLSVKSAEAHNGNTISIVPDGIETIDGQSSHSVSELGGVKLFCDGTQWLKLSLI
jgi:hypothetical protein